MLTQNNWKQVVIKTRQLLVPFPVEPSHYTGNKRCQVETSTCRSDFLASFAEINYGYIPIRSQPPGWKDVVFWLHVLVSCCQHLGQTLRT